MRVFSQKMLVIFLLCLQGCFSSSSPELSGGKQSRSGEGGTNPIPSLSIEAQEIQELKLSMAESGVTIAQEDFLEILETVELTDEEKDLLGQLLQ